MYISNAGPHQPMAASFFNLQDQIKYVCMYVCMYVALHCHPIGLFRNINIQLDGDVVRTKTKESG